MKIFPAIDLLSKKAVRLYKGDYAQSTVYSDKPWEIAHDFKLCGAENLHLVDLDGAKSGNLDNLETIKTIVSRTDLFTEVGGGIRSLDRIESYLSIGVSRVILGTAAVTDSEFLQRALDKYKEKIAVGVDIKDGFVAIKGWTEKSEFEAHEFCKRMQKLGVGCIICTDISKDGAMKGTNRVLYRELSEELSLDIMASGGVSDIEDVKALAKMNLYGAIIGKAYYTGAIDLTEALRVAKGE